MAWYKKVSNDISNLIDAIKFYEKELDDAMKEAKIAGNLEQNAQRLSGHMSYRYAQLQDIEAILKLLNIQLDQIRSIEYVKFSEHYKKALTDRAIEKYIDGVQDVVDMSVMINDIALIRNMYLGVIKGFETKTWMISHITKLRAAGLEDINFEDFVN